VSLKTAPEFINEHMLLVSTQLANSEISTIQQVEKLAALAHENGAFFHCDAAQAAGKIPRRTPFPQSL